MKNKINDWPVIIGGFYRSGTSLVRRLFDSHPNFYCGPEVKFFKDFYADYLSDPLAHVRYFSSVRSMSFFSNWVRLLTKEYLICFIFLCEIQGLKIQRCREHAIFILTVLIVGNTILVISSRDALLK